MECVFCKTIFESENEEMESIIYDIKEDIKNSISIEFD